MLRRFSRAADRLGSALVRLPRRAATALGGADAEPRQARLWQAMVLVLPIAGAAAWALPRVILVMSPSIDAWVLRAAPGAVRRGDLVAFMLSHPLAGPTPVLVTKYALCLPGERIEWIERSIGPAPGAWEARYYCEDRLLGISRPTGHDGRPLAHWRPAYRRIPPGMIYVGSAHPLGFDSRYYGPVALHRLTRMEKLL